MFLSTLGIGKWSVHSWVTTSSTGIHRSTTENETPSRKRAKCDGSPRQFLNSLPKVESHYSRKDTSKIYIESVFNTFTELYTEYKTYCGEHNLDAVSIITLRKEFNDQNLGLFKPRKDQCDICCEYNVGNVTEEEYKQHIEKKDKARDEKTKDKADYDSDAETVVLTVNLEAVLLSSNLKASAMYYKSKLACHNYTIYNLHDRSVTCYFWHEGEGSLDVDSFASCLLDFLQSDDKCKAAKHIIVYSDGCPYQNRNQLLSNALLYFADKTGTVITQKFLEKGHTQMECDSVQAACERAFKGRDIYVPGDYIKRLANARKDTPYTVKYVDHSFFNAYEDINYYASIRPGNKAGDPIVTDIRQLRYTAGEISYKLDY